MQYFGSVIRQMMQDAPAGLWPMQESSGAAKDVSGNGRDITWTNSPTQAAAGPVGTNSVQHSRTANTYGSVVSSALWATSFTVEFWINLFDTTYGSILTNSSSGNPTPWNFDNFGSSIRFGVGDSVGNWYSGPNTYAYASSVGTWLHVVGRYDNSITRSDLFINGVSVASTTSVAGTRASNGGTMWLGKYNVTFNQSVNMRMAWLGFFPVALSDTRISAHYQAGIRAGVLLG